MLLTSTSDIIRIVTSSTADIHVQAGWADITTTVFTPGRTNTAITTAATTTIVGSPAASTQRQVKTLSIFNTHASTSNTVTVQHYDGTTSVDVYEVTLAAGERAQYNGDEWPSSGISSGTGVTDGDKGDITVSASGATWTIDNGAVTLAKQADMATASLVYRKTAGAGAPEVNTLATLKTDLGLTGTNSGDQTISLTGDVTGSGTGSFAATIANDAVTYAKMQNVSATDKLLGRSTAGSGDVEEITCTAAGRDLLDDADASAQRTTLGLGTLATQSGTFSGTSSGTNTGDQNLFQTISVSGQSDVVADSTTDTLTLAAGSNITITTNAGTDTITIAASGGGGGGGVDAYTTTATAAGTTTLTSSSNYQQYFTGVTTQTVVMPVTSTLSLGYSWRIVNNSTGTVTVQSSGANNIIALIANTEAILTCILTSGTTAASWSYQIQPTESVGTGTGQLVRATSPTLVTPALGTPASGVLTNCTGLPPSGITVRPAFSAKCSGNTTVNTATYTKIAVDNEVSDNNSNYDPTTNYRFTPTVSGNYIITFAAAFLATADQVYQIAAIYKNGSVYAQLNNRASGTADQQVQVTCIVAMNGSTDYLEAYAYHERGSSTTVGGFSTTFTGAMI